MIAALIVRLNRLFHRPRVEGRESAEAYSEWEYRWGRNLVARYLKPAGDLEGKRVLDVGCGLGGKTVAYAEAGAAGIVGVDLSLEHVVASRSYARSRGAERRCSFTAGDASALPLPGGAFDTVVANDAMEHFARPDEALGEMIRVTRPGGAIWLFFTPHFSPLGSHLYDYIYIPWCHLIFRRDDLGGAIREVLRRRDPGASAAAVDAEVEEIMTSFDRDLNHMSIRRFHRILGLFPEVEVAFEELKPAKFEALSPLTKVPFVRELFTGTVVCRLMRKQEVSIR